MTKRHNKRLRFLVAGLALLELILLAGTYALQYFTRKRLGMLRHVVYLNGKWGANYPIETIKSVALVVLAFMILVMIFTLTRVGRGRRAALLSILLSAIAFGFIVGQSPDVRKAYYLMGITLTLASCVQFLIALLVRIASNNQKATGR